MVAITCPPVRRRATVDDLRGVKIMEKFLPPSQQPGKNPPLSFSLVQAAALCGVAVHRLSEWADCGYVRSVGQGDDRRFDRHSLRQILAIRSAVRSADSPGSPASTLEESSSQWTPAHVPVNRPEEFLAPGFPLNDRRLGLQIEIFFALNPNMPRTAERVAASLHADIRQTRRLLDAMASNGVVCAVEDGEVVYGPGRARLRGPNIREQRIRATRRSRVPSSGQ